MCKWCCCAMPFTYVDYISPRPVDVNSIAQHNHIWAACIAATFLSWVRVSWCRWCPHDTHLLTMIMQLITAFSLCEKPNINQLSMARRWHTHNIWINVQDSGERDILFGEKHLIANLLLTRFIQIERFPADSPMTGMTLFHSKSVS